MAEMVTNRPIFEGENSTDQLLKIMKIIGTPTTKDLKAMKAKDPNVELPAIQPMSLKRYLTKINAKVEPALVDLLVKLLVFDPNKRLRPREALADQYF